jgi:hypothetical protein
MPYTAELISPFKDDFLIIEDLPPLNITKINNGDVKNMHSMI